MFSSKIFIGFKFWSMIHFKLIFLYNRGKLQVQLFAYDVQLCQHHLLKICYTIESPCHLCWKPFDHGYAGIFLCLFIYLFIYLFWLCQVLVVAHRILVAACFFSCSMHVGSSSLTRDQTRAPCIESTESYPLDHQGSPCVLFICMSIFTLKLHCLEYCSFISIEIR